MSVSIDKIELPEGWTAEAIQSSNNHILINAPNQAGMVTIDFKERVFRLGYTMTGRPHMQGVVYVGRGWKKDLISDAVAALRVAIT